MAEVSSYRSRASLPTCDLNCWCLFAQADILTMTVDKDFILFRTLKSWRAGSCSYI